MSSNGTVHVYDQPNALCRHSGVQRVRHAGSWDLKTGMRLAVNLKDSGTGELVVADEYKPGCWHATWRRDGSPYDGRTFEIGKQGVSDIMPMHGGAMPANTTWTTLIRLAA